MTKKKTDAKPAPYPLTNTSEYDSVATLIHILDKSRIKPDVKVLDKVPNTDGIFEIVSLFQHPIGKIDVQIKTLAKKNFKTPKYQCNKEFLVYCETSILPVILIAVNAESECAYWVHLDSALITVLSKMIKGDSVNVDFPTDQVIKKRESGYVQLWEEIVRSRLTRIINFDIVSASLKKMQRENKKLKKVMNPALGITKDIFREIHLFLDHYNRLLDFDFSIVKDIFYPECWKMGFAYSEFLDNKLSCSLYPINFDNNDVQIKEFINQDRLAESGLLNFLGHYRDNPVKSNPREYAYSFIIDKLKDIVNNYALLPLEELLAQEQIFRFIDLHHIILGLQPGKDTYSVEEIVKAFFMFFPTFLTVFFINNNNTESGYHFPADIDHISYHSQLRDLNKATAATEKLLEDPSFLPETVEVQSKEFNMRYLLSLVTYVDALNVTRLQRPYPVKHYPPKSKWVWDCFNIDDVRSILSTVYSSLPKIYNRFVQEFFPNISDKIQFYQGFNRMMIIVHWGISDQNPTGKPGAHKIYLRNLENPDEQRIDIYFEGEDEIPLTWGSVFDYRLKDFEFEGSRYKIISSSSGQLEFLYESTPLLYYLYDALKRRLQEYLSPYHKNLTSIFKSGR